MGIKEVGQEHRKWGGGWDCFIFVAEHSRIVMDPRLMERPSMCEKCFTVVPSFYSTTDRSGMAENRDRVRDGALD